MLCPSCESECPADARFCPACGTALTTRPDERRVVSVVFGDLVGFTSLAETRDPEEIKLLVDRCFARLAADITAFGGQVDKVVGDAIVALFGATQAHEDDAERAVRAALQMQRTMGAYARDHDAAVEMRIGVNTGESLVGGLEADTDVTAMGDVVNIASRLQTSAAPGEVLVGPATHAATERAIEFESIGELVVKGRGPVPAWRAVSALAPPGRRRKGASSPLVGRDVELGLLEQVCELAAERRRAHLVMLVGDAGVGKSRLADEIAERSAAGRDAFVLRGQCVPYGEANIWWPVAEALREACGIETSDAADDAVDKARYAITVLLGDEVDPGEIDRVVDGLVHVMGFSATLHDVDPTRARDAVTRSMQIAIEGIARQRPVVIVLSDAHWADDLVLQLLERLLEGLAQQPVVLVATGRPELIEKWQPAHGHFGEVHLRLDPLDAEASARLLDVLLGDRTSADVRRQLLERSGGNPFFLEELASLLADDAVVGTELGSGSLDSIPATLRGLVAARVDALAPELRRVLEDAAVIGHAGSLEVVTALAAEHFGVEAAAAAVTDLVAEDLLVLDGDEFEFKSDLVREVAYNTMAKATRARRHAAVALLTEQDGTGRDRAGEMLERLAHHWGTAADLSRELGGVDGVPDDVTKNALMAIHAAASRTEADENHLATARLLDLALRLLPDTADDWRLPILKSRAEARAGVHDLAGARADVELLRTEAAAAGEAGYGAWAMTLEGDVLQKEGRLDEAAVVLADALAAWRTLDDHRGEASALRLKGFCDLFRGRLDDADEAIREALDLFRGLGDRRGEAWALQNLAWIAFNSGQPDLAEERLGKASAAFSEVGDWGGYNWSQGLLAWVYFQQGRLDDATDLADSVIVRASSTGERWPLGILQILRAMLKIWKGKAREGLEVAAEARRIFDELDDQWGRFQALNPTLRGLLATGHVQEAFAVADQASALAEANPDPALRAFTASLRMSAAADAGERHALERAIEEQGHVDDTEPFSGENRLCLARSLLQLGRLDDAIAEIDSFDNDLSGGLLTHWAGAAALVYAAAGRGDDARVAAARIDETSAGTYLDRVNGAVAVALARAAVGETESASAALARARALVDSTDDVLTSAVVSLAAAHVTSDRDGRRRALEEFEQMGVVDPTWDAVFRVAVAGGPAPVEAAGS